MGRTYLISIIALAFWMPGAMSGGEQVTLLKQNGSANFRLEEVPAYRTIRVFEDASTHRRWILYEDLNHLARPAKLAQTAAGSNCDAAQRDACVAGGRAARFVPPAVIRNGDSILITQHTPAADGLLEATALGEGMVGETIKVRLRRGGRILSVIAEGPGRARMTAAGMTIPGSEGRP